MQNSRKKHAKAAPLRKPRRLGISPSSKWALRGATRRQVCPTPRLV
jgi:hypothetical protein